MVDRAMIQRGLSYVMQTLSRYIEKSAFILLWVFVAVFFLRPMETEDVWWHLSAGRFMAENHHVPLWDPFSFNGEKIPWTLNQWLGSLLIHGLYSLGALDALRVSRMLLIGLSLFVFFLNGRKAMTLLKMTFLILLMSFGLGLRTQMRPDLWNVLFIQILLGCLFGYLETSRNKFLVAITALGVVWSNMHLGAFIYGSLMIGIFLLGLLIASFNPLREKSPALRPGMKAWLLRGAGLNPGERKFWNFSAPCAEVPGAPAFRPGGTTKGHPDATGNFKKFKALGMTFVAFHLGFLINPYGIQGFLYAFRAVLDPNFIGFYKFNAFIIEMEPPWFILSIQGLWFWVLCIWVARVLMQNKDFLQTILFLAALGVFLYGQRGVILWTLVAGNIIIRRQSMPGPAGPSPGRKTLKECALSLALVAILILNIVHTVNKKVYAGGQFSPRWDLEQDVFCPRKIVSFMLSHGLEGKIFNSDKYGGYLIFQGYPRLRPFVDGRQLNKEAWQVYRDVVSDPERNWPLAQKNFDFVLIDTHASFNSRFLEYMNNHPDWRLAYLEGFALLFMRDQGPSFQPREALEFEQNLEKAEIPEEDLEYLAAGDPGKDPGILKRFMDPEPFYVEDIQEGLLLYRLGFKNAGIRRIAGYFKAHPSHDARFLLNLMIKD